MDNLFGLLGVTETRNATLARADLGRTRLIADCGGLPRPRSGRDEGDDNLERKFFKVCYFSLGKEKNGASAYGLASHNKKNPGCHR